MALARASILLLAVSLTACTDVSEQVPTSPRPRVPGIARPSLTELAARMVTLDDQFEAVATVEPSFGGLYFDKGTMHVVLTDATRNPALVRQAIHSVFGESRLLTAPLVIHQGRYGFGQLATWNRQLPKVFAVKGVNSTDIDEVNNRLSVGVESDDVRAPATELLTGLGVPAEAITFHKAGASVALQSLGGQVRQITGGVHIDFPGAGNFCTLGLNVSLGGQASFMTNGHCTSSWGTSNDGTPFWQANRNVNADFVGTEGLEAQVFGSATDSRCPPSTPCKWSEVAFVPFTSAMITQQSMGHLARTTTRTQYDSNLVINSSNPTIAITNKTLFPFVGDVVDKIGARTGWTSGPVTEACANRKIAKVGQPVAFELICTHAVNAGINGGDSGASVFVYDAASGTASWAGQAFGGTAPNNSLLTVFHFAPLNNIQSEFGSIPATIYGT